MDIEIKLDAELKGILTEKDVQRIFPSVSKIVGADQGFISIVEDPKDPSSKALAIKCPGKVIQENKTRIRLKFLKAESATITYKVFFSEDFDFVRGGKLPGFAGGSSPSGGKKSDGSDGFSARVMWREEGEIFQYLYWMERTPEKRWGDDLPWLDLEGNMKPPKFIRGNWHTLKTEISMNTPGERDGSIKSWLDEKLALSTMGAFRAKGADFGIDQVIFTTFFGGNDETWIPTKDERVYFKDICIKSK